MLFCRLRRLILFPILLGLLAASSQAQNRPARPDSTIIESILFVGNDGTKEYILAREMQLREGDPYDPEIAEQDRLRILNLKLFHRVEFDLLPGETGVILLVLVAEKWYLFPYPIVFIHDRDWSKLSYGAGIIYENMRGRNITFSGNGYLGYNPAFSLTYRDPWVQGTRRIAFSVSAYYKRVRNQSLLCRDFDEKHMGLALSAGRRLGYYGLAEIGVEYRQVDVAAEQGVSLSQNGIDHLPAVALQLRYDHRDYYVLPMRGWYFAGYLQAVYNGATANYQLAGSEIRRYQPLGGGISLALRARADGSRGKVPLYNHLYIGYSERVRGQFRTIVEGTRRALASTEVRIPLVKTRYVSIEQDEKPWASYLRDLPVGCHVSLFYDTGIARFHDQSWAGVHWLSGFGIGLNVQLPYAEMIRFERAWNSSGRGEYIVDLKVWF